MTSGLRRLTLATAVALLAWSVPATDANAMADDAFWCELTCAGGWIVCSQATTPDMKVCDIALDGCIYGCGHDE